MPASKSIELTNKLFSERAFQIALVGAILFLVIAHPIIFNLVDRLIIIGIQLGDTLLVVVHSLVYAVALYYSVFIIIIIIKTKVFKNIFFNYIIVMNTYAFNNIDILIIINDNENNNHLLDMI